MKMSELYERTTNRIIADLEAGTVPWLKPWRNVKGVKPHLPHNAATNREYNGANVPMLWMSACSAGFRNPGWLTYRQAVSLGGYVKKGEKGTPVVFANRVLREGEAEGDPDKIIPILRSYTVFNVEQCVGLPGRVTTLEVVEPVLPPRNKVSDFVAATQADIRHGGNIACFHPSADIIRMPMLRQFKSRESYDAVLLHELVHWSGSPKRLDRQLPKRGRNTGVYAFEELVAELGCAFLCARLGVEADLRHADYIASWLTVLKNDKTAIFQAASRAGVAADYLRRYSEPVVEPEEAGP